MRKKSLISVFFILSLILVISTFKTEVFAQTTPKISIVSLEHVPFIEGDTNKFYIASNNYSGQVAYQLFYIQESIMKEWKLINNADAINGWTNNIDTKTPIIIDISKLNLKADKYRFAIRVKRVGVKGLKQNKYGDYDDSYPFNVNVVKNANVKLNGNMNIEKTNFTKNENLVISGVGISSKDIQYKLHLFDVTNSKWLTNLTDYKTNINYSLKNIPEGTYIVDLWVNNANSKGRYDGLKLKVITIKEGETSADKAAADKAAADRAAADKAAADKAAADKAAADKAAADKAAADKAAADKAAADKAAADKAAADKAAADKAAAESEALDKLIDYLNTNFSSLDTSAGSTSLAFSLSQNSTTGTGYDYMIKVKCDLKFFYALKDNKDLTSEQKQKVKDELKDFQSNLNKALKRFMPGKSIGWTL